MDLVDSAYVDSENELSQVLAFLSESYGMFHSLRNWSLTRMGDWRYGGNSRFKEVDPDFFSRNLHVWREGARIVGLAVSERGDVMTLQVSPDRRDLEDRILTWIEDQWGRDKDRIVVSAFAHDVWRQNLLKRRGYHITGSRWFLRRYDTMLSPHASPLMDGFSLTDLGHSGDANGTIEVINKAFGKQSINQEWFESKRKAPGFLPSMLVQVLSPGGRCVSCTEARIDWKQNYAEIDPIATHPDYQRMGLAKACLAETFRRLAGMKVRDAYIGSDTEAAPSNRVYDAMLPIEKLEEFSWELAR
ncbi:MAG TPA: GNAT family N-acetyltransferase [Methanomassiliicoccales archaeon]|jgi:GNAT superfamily N-acetyltransferase